MDLIFYLGNNDPKLPKFLERLGYAVIGTNSNVALPDFLSRTNVDLILIDGRVMGDVADLCSFFRSQENTRAIPIVCISPESSSDLYANDIIEKVDIVQAPFSVGSLAGHIATQLRLRKRLEAEAPERLRLKMWGYPYLSWVAILAMLAIVAAMAFIPDQRAPLLFGVLSTLAMLAGYVLSRRRARGDEGRGSP